jgi:hypothetical protein
MSDKLTAADALRKWQKQCDPEGIEVQVSRQALDEVLDALEAKDAEIERLTAENAEYLRNGSKMLAEIERLRAEKYVVVSGDSLRNDNEALQAEIERLQAVVDAATHRLHYTKF